MNIAFPVVMSVFALLSGYLGWRLATRSVYRRSYYDEGLSRSDRERHARRLITGRKVRRLVVVAAFAIAGAVVGYILLLAVVYRR
jgi:hypothetical protein